MDETDKKLLLEGGGLNLIKAIEKEQMSDDWLPADKNRAAIYKRPRLYELLREIEEMIVYVYDDLYASYNYLPDDTESEEYRLRLIFTDLILQKAASLKNAVTEEGRPGL